MVTGCDPNYIDHINGNRVDNRFLNLRSCDHETNMRNAPKRKDCASGYPGVSLYKPTGKWQARIGVNRTNSDGRISLGHFATFEEAVAARQAAETEYGYLTARPF